MILLFVGEGDVRIADLSKADSIHIDQYTLTINFHDDFEEYALDDGNKISTEVMVRLAGYLALHKNKEDVVVNLETLIDQIRREIMREATIEKRCMKAD